MCVFDVTSSHTVTVALQLNQRHTAPVCMRRPPCAGSRASGFVLHAPYASHALTCMRLMLSCSAALRCTAGWLVHPISMLSLLCSHGQRVSSHAFMLVSSHAPHTSAHESISNATITVHPISRVLRDQAGATSPFHLHVAAHPPPNRFPQRCLHQRIVELMPAPARASSTTIIITHSIGLAKLDRTRRTTSCTDLIPQQRMAASSRRRFLTRQKTPSKVPSLIFFCAANSARSMPALSYSASSASSAARLRENSFSRPFGP